MKLTQALLLALTAVKFAQAIPQNNNFNGFGGADDNGQDDNGQDQNNNNGDDQNNNGQDDGQGNDQAADQGNNANGLCLDPNNVQDGSNSPGDPDEAAGQSDSITDPANFINFCSGKTKTDGLQVQGGSCNGVVMGDIPSTGNMISAIIVSPGPMEDIDENTDFDISVQITNLVAGTFTDPDTTYYSAPQQLQGGNVVGHTHVTVQNLNGDVATTTPPDPQDFDFFKGINDDGNGNGLLSATVTGGLSAGVYRVCSMTSASNHQAVIMPVAQRGAQDDCQKFTVGGAGGNAGNNGDNDAGNDAGDDAGNNAGDDAGDDAGNNAGNNAGDDGDDNAAGNGADDGNNNGGDDAATGDDATGNNNNNGGFGNNAGDDAGDDAATGDDATGNNAGDDGSDDTGNGSTSDGTSTGDDSSTGNDSTGGFGSDGSTSNSTSTDTGTGSDSGSDNGGFGFGSGGFGGRKSFGRKYNRWGRTRDVAQTFKA